MRYMVVIMSVCTLAYGVAAQQVEDYPIQWKYQSTGKMRVIISNMGIYGAFYGGVGWPNFHWEYPIGSGAEHMDAFSIWVGGIKPTGDTIVIGGWLGYYPWHELWPSTDDRDTIWESSIVELDELHGVYMRDDDGDGLVDEEWFNGWDDDGDGLIDEDYATLSDQDFTMVMYDYSCPIYSWPPYLYIKLVQTTHAWRSSMMDDMILFRYWIINQDTLPIYNLFLGYMIHPAVGYPEIAEGDWGAVTSDDYVRYDPKRKLVICFDAPDGRDGTVTEVVAVGFFDAPGQDTTGVYQSFHYFRNWDNYPEYDNEAYKFMSDGVIQGASFPDGLIGMDVAEAADLSVINGWGPFGRRINDTLRALMPGDTLKIAGGLFGGEDVEALRAYYDFGVKTYRRNYQFPPPPPPPEFRVRVEGNKVILDWSPIEGGRNPEEFIDTLREDGHYKDFAGYRVYRATNEAGPFQMLAEFDKKGVEIDTIVLPDTVIIDTVDHQIFGSNTGISYTFVDSGLIMGVTYYYVVTAYDLPDPIHDMPSQESALASYVKEVQPGPPPVEDFETDKPFVVPNPYFGNVDYTTMTSPPWEVPRYPAIGWTEEDRKIMFANIPARCVIRIYSLAGDLVKTIRHEDENKGFAFWDLLSEQHQAVASGIYIYSVENLDTGDIYVGKFVVIK